MAAQTAEVVAKSLGRALSYHLKAVNLAPVKNINVSFDPFSPSVASIRHFVFAISASRRAKTNPECRIKTNIASDRSDPSMLVTFNNGNQALFKTKNLQMLDIVREFNKLCVKNNVA